MNELREIDMEKPDWLKLRGADAYKHIPIAYVSDNDWVERGYVTMELADDKCVVYDAEDGSFDFVNISNMWSHGDPF